MEKAQEFLAHYGIPKMRWGFRRFQNKDGTLTPEGKIRYGKDGGEENSEKKEKYNSGTEKFRKDEMRNLTDAELKKRNDRLSAENNYINYLNTQKVLSDPKSKARKDAAKRIFVDSAVQAASNVMSRVYTNLTNDFLEKRFPDLVKKS